ncbi:AbrB/MazE/SpoVT family DNA-binding domain-containing protein [Oscillatoria sp. CS-180]|uniref:AbrB/MazE/SpoVT family DNA-binding domain-containing protein n=1 Tax=Oscillatoria sp. CS-180 TaxID=3021720 RepID=UPI00232E7EFD|nr:AbrB/MazE/SpoVT family DNA-binding domain-containing protein [Oscillatoria sp. CS-180]MDB9526903.1 AbrB/MazE/SpoVT family DNA-binding domain-containing protein [Oscillatoria sp. CS-180]
MALDMIIEKVSSWGNSLGIPLPPAIASQTGIKEGAMISITVEADRIVIAPAKSHHTLESLLATANSALQPGEVDFGAAIGEEHW